MSHTGYYSPTRNTNGANGTTRPGATLRTDLRTPLPTPGDPAVPPHLAKRHHLRPGDLVEFDPKAGGGRVLSVNGLAPDDPAHLTRPAFADLTPLHPTRRLRMETPGSATGRVLDLLTPIGRGQRGLLVAPPKAGKTALLREIARAVRRNHPECEVVVLLVDERPEEVTDTRRSVDAPVFASTFDRTPSDHTDLAELTLERAKRLAEAGRDAVVLVDSLTRLCRAYNLAAGPKGRTLSGGVDASALAGPKRLFGAARELEGAGSVTVLATALVDTGSRADGYFFEELKSSGNMELRLDRELAERRVYPAVSVEESGTRREELITGPAEAAASGLLRRALLVHGSPGELLVRQVRGTASNAELLTRVRSTVTTGRQGTHEFV